MTRNQLPDQAYPIGIGESRNGVGFGLGFSVRVEDSKWDPEAQIGEYGWGGAASTHFWILPEGETRGHHDGTDETLQLESRVWS